MNDTKDTREQEAPTVEHVRQLTPLSINEPPTYESLGCTLDSIDPTEAEIGSPDITLHVYGTGLIEGMQIMFNGGAEKTVHVSDSELTTTVKPSTAGVAGSFPVTLVTAGHVYEGAPLPFTFTEPTEPARAAHQADPDELEEEIDEAVEEGDAKRLHRGSGAKPHRPHRR